MTISHILFIIFLCSIQEKRQLELAMIHKIFRMLSQQRRRDITVEVTQELVRFARLSLEIISHGKDMGSKSVKLLLCGMTSGF